MTFLPKYFKLKKGTEPYAQKVFLCTLVFCILLSVANFMLHETLLFCCTHFCLFFIGIPYCILGYKQYYEITQFSGHKIIRWFLLLIAIFFIIAVAALHFLNVIVLGFREAMVFVLIFCMAITGVRNGYVKSQ